jgi:phospholipid/cholesterol/gamma-HCH transport system permease protein
MAATSTSDTPVKQAPAPPRPTATPPSAVGQGLSDAGELITFGWQALTALPRSLRYVAEALRQAATLTRGTWLLLFVMNAFLGVTVVNFGFFLLRALGATDYLGVFTGLLGPRFTALTMFGYVFAGKICCGFAAELGAMKIQQEVDAYASEGVDPMEYLVGTRIWAVIFFLPLAGALALIGETAGNFFDAVFVLHGISVEQMASVHWSVQGIADQLRFLFGAFCVAIPATIVACFFGLRASGGPASVGTAAARSMTYNLVLVHAVVGFTAVLFYGTNLQTPIGG